MSADHPQDTNHGDSIAAWSSVIVIVLGFLGATVFLYLNDMTLTWSSVGLIVVGAVLGPVLASLGFGQKK